MTPVKRLLGFIRPYTLRFLVAFFLMAIVGACEALFALLISPIVDVVLNPIIHTNSILLFKWPISGRSVYLQNYLPGWIHNAWAIVAVTIVGLALIRGLSEFFATYYINFVGHAAVMDLRNLLYTRLVRQSIAFFTSNPTGRLMSAITSDTEKIQSAVSQVSADFLKQTFTLLALLAVIFHYDWRLAAISLVLVPLVVVPSAKLGRYIRKSSRSSQDRMGEINNLLQETFSGIRIVKAFGMELFEAMKFKAATKRLLRINMRWVRAQAATSPLMEV